MKPNNLIARVIILAGAFTFALVFGSTVLRADSNAIKAEQAPTASEAAPAKADKGPAKQQANPVKAEMIMLDKAYRNIVSAVALGEYDPIVKAVNTIHTSVENTAKAMEAGTIVLPKNQDRMKEFEKMDAEFHKNLEQLVEAAKRKNRSNVLKITKRLLDGCIKCHQSFRD